MPKGRSGFPKRQPASALEWQSGTNLQSYAEKHLRHAALCEKMDEPFCKLKGCVLEAATSTVYVSRQKHTLECQGQGCTPRSGWGSRLRQSRRTESSTNESFNASYYITSAGRPVSVGNRESNRVSCRLCIALSLWALADATQMGAGCGIWRNSLGQQSDCVHRVRYCCGRFPTPI